MFKILGIDQFHTQSGQHVAQRGLPFSLANARFLTYFLGALLILVMLQSIARILCCID